MAQSEGSTGTIRAVKILLGIFATLILGALGSGLWELVFRPGIGRIGTFLTSVSSLAESTVYTTAALDPTPIPGLVVLLLLAYVPGFLGVFFLHIGFVKPYVRVKVESLYAEDLSEEEIEERIRPLRKAIRRIAVGGATFSLLLLVGAFYVVSIANSATLVWRTFNMNHAICSPHLTEDQEDFLRARFGSMRGKSDFDRIQADLNGIAASHATKLNWYASNE